MPSCAGAGVAEPRSEYRHAEVNVSTSPPTPGQPGQLPDHRQASEQQIP